MISWPLWGGCICRRCICRGVPRRTPWAGEESGRLQKEYTTRRRPRGGSPQRSALRERKFRGQHAFVGGHPYFRRVAREPNEHVKRFGPRLPWMGIGQRNEADDSRRALTQQKKPFRKPTQAELGWGTYN